MPAGPADRLPADDSLILLRNGGLPALPFLHRLPADAGAFLFFYILSDNRTIKHIKPFPERNKTAEITVPAHLFEGSR